jgi:DNA-binding transcriptional ArsR family regulator
MIDKSTRLFDDHIASQGAGLFRALSNVNQVRLLYFLSKRELNARALADLTGIDASTISHQLRDFRQMRLVGFHRHGTEVFYNVADLHNHMILHQVLLHIRRSEPRIRCRRSLIFST